MKKILKRILVQATHFITQILIQVVFLAMGIWYYDTPVNLFISYTLASLAFLAIDYVISCLILRWANGEFRDKRRIHFLDLLLAVPNAWSAVWNLLKIIIGISALRPIENAITVSILILTITALIVAERVILVKKQCK